MNLTREDLLAIRTIIQEETNPKFQSIANEFKLVRREMKGEIHTLRGVMKGEIHALRGEMKGEIHTIRGVMKGEIHTLREETQKRFNSLDKAIENVAQELVKFTGELHQDHEIRIRRLEQRL